MISLHLMAAQFFDAAELELEPIEAERIATALARTARHYPVLNKINDQAMDTFNLVTTLVGVYGTRIFALKMRKAADKARPVNVTPLHPNGARGA